MSGSWIKETFEKGIDEIQKLAKTGSIKIDIANLKKKRDERIKLIGNIILEKIRKGEMKADEFEPNYSYILDIDKRIEAKEKELMDRDTFSQPENTPAAQPSEKKPEPIPLETKVQSHESDDDDKDPHEDYINRPG